MSGQKRKREDDEPQLKQEIKSELISVKQEPFDYDDLENNNNNVKVDDTIWVLQLSLRELQQELKERKISTQGLIEKEELIKLLKQNLEHDRKEGLPVKPKVKKARLDCPYLDTIRREVLDFDFEKLCSVTLQNLNVYACLVCGKYYQGRGKSSQAYIHSLEANHHVFINLENEKVYCLPDDYEVEDPSLTDIKMIMKLGSTDINMNLNPKYTPQQIKDLDVVIKKCEDLDGVEYLPGIIGLNNLGKTDYFNVAVHALSHVPPLRDFFLEIGNYVKNTDDLVTHFGELVRKIHSPWNFRTHVDPHEFFQSFSRVSERKFVVGKIGDPVESLQFLLNHLHLGLVGDLKRRSIVQDTFQGEVEIWTNKPTVKDFVPTTQRVPFYLLALDVPPTPLFVDEEEKNILPQVPIFSILAKYDGKTVTSLTTGEDKKFIITKLPDFLIVHIKRFTKNNFFKEKNPTIVHFPLKSLDLKDYMKSPTDRTKYDLIANICHDGQPEKGSFRIHLLNKPTKQWFEMQDLTVKEILPQLLALSESYVQVYERQK